MAGKHFFDIVRADLFSGKLEQWHVDGMNRIVAEGMEREWRREWLAYALATTYHETGKWMTPIREGAYRYGPRYTDRQSRSAVTSIYNKGIISTNYSLPAGPYGQAYYGRGLVQITWYDNYLRLGERIGLGTSLAENPDMALQWDVALPLLFIGMEEGLYTTRKMAHYRMPQEWRSARAIVNGDVRKNGDMIAGYAHRFALALQHEY